MKEIKKIFIIFMAAILVMAGNLGKISAKAALVSPIINYVGVEHSPLVVGDTEQFTLTSKYDGEVQYRAFIFDGIKWRELTSGFTAAVDAKTPYVLPKTSSFKLGKYKLSVWVKTAGTKGINIKGYDTYYVAALNCVGRDNASRVYASGAAKVETNGLTVKINGIEGIGGIKGPYLYRLFIFDPITGAWANGAKEYTQTPSYTFKKEGTYVVVVHANTVNSTTWKNYEAGKTKESYEAWKTIVVTVKNEKIVKVFDTTIEADKLESKVNVTLTTDGVKQFVTATQYQIFDGTNKLSDLTNLGAAAILSQAKAFGDKVWVKLFDASAKEVKAIEVLLGQPGTIIVTPPVEIASASAINGKQVEIKFSRPVNRASAENLDNYKLAGLDGSIMYIGQVVYLDSTTVIATLDFSHSPTDINRLGDDIALKNGSSYKLTVSKELVDINGNLQREDLTSAFKFVDATIPTITNISVTSGGVHIYFNEPIKFQPSGVCMVTLMRLDKNGIPTGTNLLDNSTLLDGGYIHWEGDEHKALCAGTYQGYYLNSGSHYRLSFVGPLTDYAAHNVPIKSVDVTYVVDKTAPQVLSTKYISQKYVEVTFNKPVSKPSLDSFYWNKDGVEGNTENKSTQVLSVNEKTYRIEFGNLMAKGNNFIFVKDVGDYYNNIISTTKIPITVTGNEFQATFMHVDYGVNAANIDGDEYFTITFTNNIDPNSIIEGWDGIDTKNINLTAIDGGVEGPDTLSLGNVGIITFSNNGVNTSASILGTVSMPNSNQIKVKLGEGATTAEFSPVASGIMDPDVTGIMSYKAASGLLSVDAVPVNNNLLTTAIAGKFLIEKELYINYLKNSFTIYNNYGAQLNGTNFKINTARDFNGLTAVTSSYKGAVVALTTSVDKYVTNGSISITRNSGLGAAIDKGETLYIRVVDGSNKTSDTQRIVFNKDIEANGAITNEDFTVQY